MSVRYKIYQYVPIRNILNLCEKKFKSSNAKQSLNFVIKTKPVHLSLYDWHNLLESNDLFGMHINDKLVYGVKNNYVKLVNYCVCNSANCDFDKGTPLLEAIKNENTEIIDILLKNGAKINKTSSTLIDPISKKNCQLIEYLLAQKANIDVNNGEPLQKAILANDRDMINFLIKKGANINKVNIISIKNQINIVLIEFLIKNGLIYHV